MHILVHQSRYVLTVGAATLLADLYHVFSCAEARQDLLGASCAVELLLHDTAFSTAFHQLGNILVATRS